MIAAAGSHESESGGAGITVTLDHAAATTSAAAARRRPAGGTMPPLGFEFNTVPPPADYQLKLRVPLRPEFFWTVTISRARQPATGSHPVCAFPGRRRNSSLHLKFCGLRRSHGRKM